MLTFSFWVPSGILACASDFGIKGKSRLVKSVAGPTGAVLFKSLPDGAVLGAKCMIFRTDRQCFG